MLNDVEVYIVHWINFTSSVKLILSRKWKIILIDIYNEYVKKSASYACAYMKLLSESQSKPESYAAIF